MDYSQYIKKLELAADFTPPVELEYEDLAARPLTRLDVKTDLNAVNSSIDIIRKTRGGSWPKEQLSEEFNLLDLAWHEREFRELSSFAYVVHDANNTYTGCFYIYPMGHRTTLSEDVLGYDADISWWVTTTAYERGSYEKLYAAIESWAKLFPFNSVYYSNKEIPLNI